MLVCKWINSMYFNYLTHYLVCSVQEKVTTVIMLYYCIAYFPISSLNYGNFILEELGSFYMYLPIDGSHGTKSP